MISIDAGDFAAPMHMFFSLAFRTESPPLLFLARRPFGRQF